VSLSVPLFDGGEEAARRELAKADAAELAAQTEDLGRNLDNDAAAAWEDYRVASAAVTAAEELQDAAVATARDAKIRYELGGAPLDSVVGARQRARSASLALLRARGARSDAVLRLRGLGPGPRP
jgi:outer membrane protein TolC